MTKQNAKDCDRLLRLLLEREDKHLNSYIASAGLGISQDDASYLMSIISKHFSFYIDEGSNYDGVYFLINIHTEPFLRDGGVEEWFNQKLKEQELDLIREQREKKEYELLELTSKTNQSIIDTNESVKSTNESVKIASDLSAADIKTQGRLYWLTLLVAAVGSAAALLQYFNGNETKSLKQQLQGKDSMIQQIQSKLLQKESALIVDSLKIDSLIHVSKDTNLNKNH